ncbi:carboxymuconolactone decarboxylase family protein [Roseovarius faecimaris]|uniref:Carboxymuconolactone decarboxylase family protein n=1 Tax=Roseovarius faecimaris TaxID=2494550 RepID=A0A6I6IME6_9RHOB|nr:carboxymuconolactone decarboxylase family protein [Roseovarius faecimaris]QGX98270.1 carboxymuconolactone decarboxylase family protein [Roseovarius faecimaris]
MTEKRYPATEAQRQTEDWNPIWDQMAEMDPDYLEAFLAFRAVPQKNGPLPQKTKELIMIAINAATTHLWAPGVRRHMQNALREGATSAEILEVLQLTSIMGVHSMTLGVPILAEELERAGEA